MGPENAALAAEVNRLYGGDIEAVEAVPGFFLEKKTGFGLVPETIAEILTGSSLPGQPCLSPCPVPIITPPLLQTPPSLLHANPHQHKLLLNIIPPSPSFQPPTPIFTPPSVLPCITIITPSAFFL